MTRRGFSLIELLMAIFILGIGLISIGFIAKIINRLPITTVGLIHLQKESTVCFKF